MTKTAIIGWIISIAGMALWLYGYLVPGHPSLVDWGANLPRLISDFLPNIEAELGLILMVVAMFPLYWQNRRDVTVPRQHLADSLS